MISFWYYRRAARAAIVAGTLALAVAVLSGQATVTTTHSDSSRTGANLAETLLTTSNVNPSQFGKLYTRVVDDQIYGQPLYVSGVNIPGVGARNVVYVTTVNDTVYGFDADDPGASTPLWKTAYANPPGVIPVPRADVGQTCGTYTDFSGNIGIVGTPTIDLESQTMYLVTKTKESGNYFQRLHAIDISTGIDRQTPVVIQASVMGTGDGRDAQSTIAFNARTQNQRSGLLLDHGTVYIAWGSHCDQGPYHGWILGYDKSTLQRTFVYNTTPNGGLGGIWQSGQGLSADSDGNIYALTANGTFSGNTGKDFGNSFIKVSPSGDLLDWFTPYNWSFLNSTDGDLGIQGAQLIPNTNLILGGGKEGVLYVVDRNNMGKNRASDNTQIVQSFQGSTATRMNGSPVYWNGPTYGPAIYVWPAGDPLKVFKLVSGRFQTPAAAQSTVLAAGGMPGGMLTLSANSATSGTGIVWATMSNAGDANLTVRPGILRAIDASNVTRQLWNSEMNAANDRLGTFSKFAPPTVADGRVFVATFSNSFVAYGLLNSVPGNGLPIVNAGADQNVTLPNTVTLTGTATDDGLPNPPGALSTTWNLVTGPAAVSIATPNGLSTTVSFTVPGAYTFRLSAYDGAATQSDDVTVLVSSISGTGSGLYGQYFNDAGNGTYFTASVLSRLDAGVNYSWGLSAPDPAVQADNFSVRWTGQVLAPVSGTYTFTTSADDGVRLWVNNQLLVDDWVDQSATTRSGTMALTAGVRYDVRLEYYDHTEDAIIQLLWAYPGQKQQPIPATRLSPTAPVNQPPAVNAGPDITITLPATATLNGMAQDDGLPSPPGKLLLTWSKVSGREDSTGGTVVLSNPNAASTTVTFGADGTYVLRLSANDGAVTVSDDVTVTVNPAVVAVNVAPTVSAGSGKTITLPNSATLAGTVTDDGLPSPPAAVTTNWTQVSGPGTATLANTSALNTTVSFSAAGTYVLRLTAFDGALSSTSDVTIVVNAASLTGLTGQYFNDPGNGTHFGTLVLTRSDATVNFNWGSGSPAAGVTSDNFSARWTGQVQAPVTGTYRFSTTSNDGVRLWVNGQQIINNWTDHNSSDTSAGITLTAGVKYAIVLEYYDHTGSARMTLQWSYPGRSTQVIPASWLFR